MTRENEKRRLIVCLPLMFYHCNWLILSCSLCEEQLSGAYFAGETLTVYRLVLKGEVHEKQVIYCIRLFCISEMRLYGLGAPVYLCKLCCWWLSEIQPSTFSQCNSFLLRCLFVSYSIRFLTFYVKFLTAISHCLFSFVYFADSELTSSAGSSTVQCAVWIMESSRKNRTQVCLLFFIVVLLRIDCVFVIIMCHYLKHSQGEAFVICWKDFTCSILFITLLFVVIGWA